MIYNWSFFIRFLATAGCFLVFLFFLLPRQFHEVMRPLDGLTRLRWQILAILVLITITLIPSMVYQFFLSIGQQYNVLRSVASLVGAVNIVGLTLLFVMIYVYHKKD